MPTQLPSSTGSSVGRLRSKRASAIIRGHRSGSWRVDKTDVRVRGRWKYLFRAAGSSQHSSRQLFHAVCWRGEPVETILSGLARQRTLVPQGMRRRREGGMIKAMVGWADVGEVQAPCWRTFQNMRFEVQQRHINAWRDDPDGVWALVRTSHPDAPPLWALETFYSTEL